MRATDLIVSNSILRMIVAVVASFLFLATVQTVSAQSATVVLTINGGSSAQIVNGQAVRLDWYLAGPVSNCSINNGVGAINTSVLPTSGTATVTPPTNASTNYVLTCLGGSSSVTVTLQPDVTLSVVGGSPQTVGASTGYIDEVRVNWSSDFSTRCGNMWSEKASNPGTRTWATNSNGYLWGQGEVSGQVLYSNWPNGRITETTTFYIECFNDVTGGSSIGSTTLIVQNPPPPADPQVTISSYSPSVTLNPLLGYGFASISFWSSGTSWCSYQAYQLDGTPYPNPAGFGTWSGHTARSFTGIAISTSTDFAITCGRNAVTLGTVTYPATSTTEVVRVVLNAAGEVSDRTTLPAITISGSATPNPTTKDAITGLADTVINFTWSNAQYCYLFARRANGTTYTVSNWTRTASHNRLGGNGSQSYAVKISTSTSFFIECLRQYDVDNYTASSTEYDLGYELYQIDVVALDSAAVVADPETYIYGNAVKMNDADIVASATTLNGFYQSGGRMQVGSGASTNNQIVFPFTHPFGSSDSYDIHFKYCDENDGESTYRIYTENDGLVGTMVSNRTGQPSAGCDDSTTVMDIIATGAHIADGDTITIECDTPDDGEQCRFFGIYFGAGNQGIIQAQVSSSTGFAAVPLLWLGYNTTACTNYVATAIEPGVTYQWFTGEAAKPEFEVEQISTSTRFEVTCERPLADGLGDTSWVTIETITGAAVGSETYVIAADCIDAATSNVIPTPPGYMQHPTTNYCVPAIDLAADGPAFSTSGATIDNVAGTYSNLDIDIGIENIGIGPLLANSGIAHRVLVNLDPGHGLSPVGSTIGSFNGALGTSSNTISPALTHAFDDIPFGNHQLCGRVNLDGSPNAAEYDLSLTNNERCITTSLPVPPPPMTLSSSDLVLRANATTTLSWSINVSYLMNCTVRGPGGVNETIDTITTGYPYANSFVTSPLTSSSRFVFECVEPITNTTFTESLTIEVVPNFSEI